MFPPKVNLAATPVTPNLNFLQQPIVPEQKPSPGDIIEVRTECIAIL